MTPLGASPPKRSRWVQVDAAEHLQLVDESGALLRDLGVRSDKTMAQALAIEAQNERVASRLRTRRSASNVPNVQLLAPSADA